MAVIFGCVLKERRALELAAEALLKASFIGHDSSGLAAITPDGLKILKDAERATEFLKGLDLSGMEARACIGHLRWATHGAPYVVNTHPLTDCKGRLAVVHNGIVENFSALREELSSSGHKFSSKTDSEVLAHLVEEGLSKGLTFTRAVRGALEKAEGSIASAFICSEELDTIICACKNSRLFLAKGPEGTFCSSELCCLHGLSDWYVKLGPGELAVLKPDGFSIMDLGSLEPVEKEASSVPSGLEEAKKMGHEHMLLREIWEQVWKLADTLRLQRPYLDQMAVMLASSEEVFLVGEGSSYNACLAASYMFSTIAYRAAHAVRLGDFLEHYGEALSTKTAVLVVDEKGDGPELRRVVEAARRKGASVLGITNVLGSFLTRMARVYLCQHSGPPLGIRPLRTFTAQSLVLAQLALRMAELRGKIGHVELEECLEALSSVPSLVKKALEANLALAREVAKKYADRGFFFVLGRGIGYPTAMEGVQELAEVAGVAGLSYPAGESKHGPISLVEEGFPVIFICQKDETHDDIIGNIMEMKARGAKIISVAEEGDSEVEELSDDVLPVPSEVMPLLMPVVYTVPLQLFAYYSALARGVDPDARMKA